MGQKCAKGSLGLSCGWSQTCAGLESSDVLTAVDVHSGSFGWQCWLSARSSSGLLMGAPSHGLSSMVISGELCFWHDNWLPQNKDPERSNRSCVSIICELILFFLLWKQCYFCCILLNTRKSPKLVQIHVEGTSNAPLMGRILKSWRSYFKTTPIVIWKRSFLDGVCSPKICMTTRAPKCR